MTMKTYKIDGIRFLSKEDLINDLWENYRETMTREDFDRYVEENTVVEEREVKPSSIDLTDLTEK
jgi:hypothetical protein